VAKYDWAKIRDDYEIRGNSYSELQAVYGCSRGLISDRAKKEDWNRKKAQERLSRLKYMPIPVAEKPNYKIPKDAGYVYIISADEFNDIYKIGLAKNIEERIKGLQTACPYELKLVHCAWFENAAKVEAAFHILFECKNIRGEWFKLTRYDIELVRGYRG